MRSQSNSFGPFTRPDMNKSNRSRHNSSVMIQKMMQSTDQPPLQMVAETTFNSPTKGNVDKNTTPNLISGAAEHESPPTFVVTSPEGTDTQQQENTNPIVEPTLDLPPCVENESSESENSFEIPVREEFSTAKKERKQSELGKREESYTSPETT